MRIIAVNRFYKPDHSATAQMLADLAESLAAQGRDFTVLTSRLQYEGGPTLAPRETIAGVKVRRIWSTSFGRAGLLGRAVDYATFYIAAIFAMLGAAGRGDLLIAKTDPPLLSVAAALAARIKGARLINWCQDLFPETAAALGVGIAKGPLGGLLKAIRDWSLHAADCNAVLHERMAQRLREAGLPAEKIAVLPNWADAGIRPVAHIDNPLRAQWGLSDRFVIAYSGNLGRAHMPDKVAALVKSTMDIPSLTWLFIGGGAGLAAVKAVAGDHPGVQFRPYQPRDKLSESLSVADMHLISLEPACEGHIVPSKLYGVRAAARPILFLGAPDGAVAQDMARIAQSGRPAGLRLDPDEPGVWRSGVLTAMAQATAEASSKPADPAPAGAATAAALAAWCAEIDRWAPEPDRSDVPAPSKAPLAATL